MIIIAFFLALFVLFVIGIWLTVSLIGLIFTLLVAFVVGWVAEKVLPGSIPYGWIGAIVFGLLGSWVGGIILGDAGPDIGGIAVFPAIVGAVILALIGDLIFKTRSGRALR
jgi:uncharacterized membrane protein YeaQ/YmgE (transglycosylase-associated protein family)